MKKIILPLLFLPVLFSCKKEKAGNGTITALIQDIKAQLADSMKMQTYKELDFNNIYLSSYPNTHQRIIRVPFTHKSVDQDFVLLDITNENLFTLGKLISLRQDSILFENRKNCVFNGSIVIRSLDETTKTYSGITNGNIDIWHKTNTASYAKDEVVEVPLMPEVIVSSSYQSNTGNSYSNYYNLQSILNGGGQSMASSGGGIGGGSTGGYYNSGSPSSGTAPGSQLPGPGSAVVIKNDDPAFIDFELAENLPAIDLAKYLKCFGNIPDAGATCSIKIATDIPFDKDPTKFFDWGTLSPGHTFLQIIKANGAQRIQQNIGFYPAEGYKVGMTTEAVKGKLVDNAGHEFNASLVMDITPDQLKGILIHMQYLAGFIKYDIDDYNCTDFALEVFNYKRGGNQLIIPMYDIMGGMAPNGTATPQGLYQQLKKMQSQGGPEAKNINIPGVKGYAGNSNGPCN